jgi:hypothetical protein
LPASTCLVLRFGSRKERGFSLVFERMISSYQLKARAFIASTVKIILSKS